MIIVDCAPADICNFRVSRSIEETGRGRFSLLGQTLILNINQNQSTNITSLENPNEQSSYVYFQPAMRRPNGENGCQASWLLGIPSLHELALGAFPAIRMPGRFGAAGQMGNGNQSPS